MATDTHTVTVSDMATGALLRISSVAGEAQRASTLPLAGLTHSQRIDIANGAKMTDAQVATLAKKAQRNALRIAEREALALSATLTADTLATVATYGTRIEAGNDEWQAGYDY